VLHSITFWLILLSALGVVTLGWLLVRAALVVGGQAAAAHSAKGIDHAYQAWARFGPLRVQADRAWEAGRGRLEVWLFGWRVVNRELEQEEPEPPKEKALARRPSRLRGRVDVDWIELTAWALERRYLVALDPVHGFLRFGLGDPARTGEVSGLLCALTAVLPRGLFITHEAVFDRDVLEAEASGALRIYPIPMLSWLAWFVLSRVKFHARPRQPLPAAEEK